MHSIEYHVCMHVCACVCVYLCTELIEMSRSVAEDFAALEEMKKNEETDEQKFQVFQIFCY